MRKTHSLNDSHWFIGAVAPQPFPAPNDFAQVEGWLPATVPGDVRLDLLAINKIPDPFLGKNNEASQWIDEYDWWYRRDVELKANDSTRTFLLFQGIDYQSAIYWNESALGKHVGMFSRQVYEIPRATIHPGTNRLSVRISGGNQLPRLKLNPQERVWQGIAGRFIPHAAQAAEFPDRYATLKCQMSYGWDFAPRLFTCGIWDDARIVQTREIFMRDVWVQGVPDGRVRITLDMDTRAAKYARVQFEVRGKNFQAPAQQFEFPSAVITSGVQDFSIQLETPRPWNPWDRGAPNVYSLHVIISDEQGVLDTYETAFGLRTVELEQNAKAPPDSAPWTFTLNGQPEFIRGANWVPADSIPARVTREDYAALLQLARDANINLLRVWGGGLKEKRAFYELCDELGILVWQEFPFAGAGVDYFPRDLKYLAVAEQECGAIVRTLRNHPSIVLWCGGNEFIPRANRHIIDLMRDAVAKYDGTRPFKPASPSQDESHNWRVWHGKANTRDYQQDPALFFGEFGLQAAPNVETLQRFLPEDATYPPNAWWDYHNAERDKLWRYADPILSSQQDIQTEAQYEISLKEFVQASQTAQLRGLQVAVEHARRSKPRVSGCAFWQFNEPWYSICWSVVDYTRTPKRAYHKIKELYNPVLVSFAYPLRRRSAGEIVSGQVWLVNDLLDEQHGTLSAWHNETLLLALDVSLPPNSAIAFQDLDVQLGKGANVLRFELRGQDWISTNEYDLTYCDEGEINSRRTLLTNAAVWLRTST